MASSSSQGPPADDVMDVDLDDGLDDLDIIVPLRTGGGSPLGGEETFGDLEEQGPSQGQRRESALAKYFEGDLAGCQSILEDAVVLETRPGGWSSSSAIITSDQRLETLYMLVQLYSTRALRARRSAKVTNAKDLPEALKNEISGYLTKANYQLKLAEDIESIQGYLVGPQSLACKGFVALAKHTTGCECIGDELGRAERFFDAALKLDVHHAHANLGRAILYTAKSDWARALVHFRVVLQRGAGVDAEAPGVEQVTKQAVKDLRLAVATCFAEMGRHTMLHSALDGVLALHPEDTEALCCLLKLERRTTSDDNKDRIQQLQTQVSELAKDPTKSTPVVLCELADAAFHEGLAKQQAEPHEENEQWELAERLLMQAQSITRSEQVHAEIFYQLGRMQHAQGDFQNCLENYRQGCEHRPEHHACSFGLAQACLQSGNFLEAVEVLEKLKKVKGPVPEVLKLLTYTYLNLPELKKQSASKAVASSELLVKTMPEDLFCKILQAEAHDQAVAQETGDAEPVVKIYEELAELLEKNADARHSASPQVLNNLGALRIVSNDYAAARKALESSEAKLKEALEDPQSVEDLKDLKVTGLVLKFNKAWLEESEGGEPKYVQAAQEYMSLTEQQLWHADAHLRLAAQWNRAGCLERALERCKDAMQNAPVLACLRQAAYFLENENYDKALEAAKAALQKAGRREVHYAQVALGNIYLEISRSPAKTKAYGKDKDTCLREALDCYVEALRKKRDCFFAANGIGVVLACRGNMEAARRAFQAVTHLLGSKSDACVFENLGHTYLSDGGSNARKALAFYEKALKARPEKAHLRLCMAKAWFELKEYERAGGLISDSMQVWPEDLILRYNLALTLELQGMDIVRASTGTNRLLGTENDVTKLEKAVQKLSSASRLFENAYSEWVSMGDQDKKDFVAESGLPEDIVSETLMGAEQHHEYCDFMKEQASAEIADLKPKVQLLNDTIQASIVTKQRAEEEKQKARESQQPGQLAEGANEDDVLRHDLDEVAETIHLGRNLEQSYKPPKAPAAAKAPKVPKAPKKGKDKEGGEDGEFGEEDGAEGGSGRKRKGRSGGGGGGRSRGARSGEDGGEGGAGGDGEGHRRKKKKKSKHHRRHHESGEVGGEGGGLEGGAGDDEINEAVEGLFDAEGEGEEGKSRKHRSDREGGRRRKRRKHRHHRSGGGGDDEEFFEEGAGGEGGFEEAPVGDLDEAANKEMEEELFGDL